MAVGFAVGDAEVDALEEVDAEALGGGAEEGSTAALRHGVGCVEAVTLTEAVAAVFTVALVALDVA